MCDPLCYRFSIVALPLHCYPRLAPGVRELRPSVLLVVLLPARTETCISNMPVALVVIPMFLAGSVLGLIGFASQV
jgi:hypothetical protein